MPDLPTISVTQSQLNVLTGVFPGETNAEKAEAYRSYVINCLIDLVLQTRTAALQKDVEAFRAQKIEEIMTTLPPRPPRPNVPPNSI